MCILFCVQCRQFYFSKGEAPSDDIQLEWEKATRTREVKKMMDAERAMVCMLLRPVANLFYTIMLVPGKKLKTLVFLVLCDTL